MNVTHRGEWGPIGVTTNRLKGCQKLWLRRPPTQAPPFTLALRFLKASCASLLDQPLGQLASGLTWAAFAAWTSSHCQTLIGHG